MPFPYCKSFAIIILSEEMETIMTQEQQAELIKKIEIQEILSLIQDHEVQDFDIVKFIRYLGQIDGITFWVTLGRGIQELEAPKPYTIHVQPGNAGYATYMLMDDKGNISLGGHGHLQVSSVDKISFEVLPSCTCLPATYNIFFEDIALRSALLNISFPVWWNPGKPAFYQYYPDAHHKFMELVSHFGSVMMKVDGKWIQNNANISHVDQMHQIAHKRFERIYTKINYANQGRSDVTVDEEHKHYVVRSSGTIS